MARPSRLEDGMRSPLALALALLLVASSSAFAAPGLAGCDAFLEKVRTEASDLGVEFSHALVVSRARSDTGMFDITTKSEADGVLTCRGDSLVRFEAHVSEPASARALTSFERLSEAAIRASLGWDVAKSKQSIHDMSADAKAFLAASKERGDVFVAGKTEEHAPGGVSLGLIQTEVDRAFIIYAPTSN
jgi:hypothetical protein